MDKHNEDEMISWGATESATRKEELSDIQSQEHLERVQAAVRARRKAAGLSRGDALRAIMMAERHARGEPHNWGQSYRK